MHYDRNDRAAQTRTLIDRAKTAFDSARSGMLRGRQSFSTLLGAQSDLRLAGLDPATEAAYRPLQTTLADFTGLLRDEYRRAARENYEDSTDARFAGANRSALEAVSDMHLVPAYMELGGLDPAQDAAWQEIGISREDYLAVRRARLVDAAAHSYAQSGEQGRRPNDSVLALESALYYLREAGFDTNGEETYQALQTTRQDFEALMTGYQQRSRTFPSPR